MSKIWENILKKFGQYSEVIADKSGVYLKKAVNKGDEITKIGKIQFEIEKLKREFLHKNARIGEYVINKKKENSSLDFSADEQLNKLTEDSIKVQLHLQNREEEKKKVKSHQSTSKEQEEESTDL